MTIPITRIHIRRVLDAHYMLQAPWCPTPEAVEAILDSSLPLVVKRRKAGVADEAEALEVVEKCLWGQRIPPGNTPMFQR